MSELLQTVGPAHVVIALIAVAIGAYATSSASKLVARARRIRGVDETDRKPIPRFSVDEMRRAARRDHDLAARTS